MLLSCLSRVSYSCPAPDDVLELEDSLRASDRAEIVASHGDDIISTIEHAVDSSDECATVRVDGELLCLFGVVDVSTCAIERVGSPWLLTTDLMDRTPVVAWKLSVVGLTQLRRDWDVLVNAIDVRHTTALRWAERLGLSLGRAEEYGVGRRQFRRFEDRG